jgi:hypothetical protein
MDKNEFFYDRRGNHRFKISGAQVEYKIKKGGSARMPLINMSRHSVRFEVKHDVHPGYLVDLEIIIPGKDKISLKGSITWVTNSRPPYFAVAQFFPFGTDKRYNSLHCLEQLKQVEAEYLYKIE